MTWINRREFTASVILGATTVATAQQPKPTLDLHVHLFGTGDTASGCKLDDKIVNSVQFQALSVALGIRKKARTFDEGYVAVLVEHAKTSGMHKVAIHAQDVVYDTRGETDWQNTSWFVPNDYVLDVAKRYRDRLIPCPSINPLRKDAMDELARIREKGARLFTIHPSTQGVDLADRRHLKFYQRCSALKMVVLVHTGHEHSIPVLDKNLAHPSRLEFMLDQGLTVVACRSGTGWPSDAPDHLPAFLNLLKRYPRLWGDTASLGAAGRVKDFFRLLDTPMVSERLLHGSDFPYANSPSAFSSRISKEAVQNIYREKSWLAKDFLLKDAVGIGRASAERAWTLVMKEST